MATRHVVVSKPLSIVKLVHMIVDMSDDVADVLHRIYELEDIWTRLESFPRIVIDLYVEIEGIRAWCIELRLLHRDDIAADSFPMSWGIALGCDKLIAVHNFMNKRNLTLDEIEQKTHVPTKVEGVQEQDIPKQDVPAQDIPEQDVPERDARITRLQTLLEGMLIGLRNINRNIEHGRERKPSSSGQDFKPYDEPLKAMWDTAIEGLRILTKECQTEEWTGLLDELFCWGCGQFQHPFPLDLYFD